jgi:hypothetical protein
MGFIGSIGFIGFIGFIGSTSASLSLNYPCPIARTARIPTSCPERECPA